MSQASIEETNELEEFLKKKCQTTHKPLNMNAVAGEFIKTTGSATNKITLMYRLVRCRDQLVQTPGMDLTSKVKQLFALGVSIDGDFVNKLKQNAEVTVDDDNRITKYIAKDGSLTLRGAHLQYTKKNTDIATHLAAETTDVKRTHVDLFSELNALIKFVMAKCRTSNKPLGICRTVNEFIEMTKSNTKEGTLRNRLHTFRENIHENSDLDLNTKVNLLYKLSVPVGPEFEKVLLQNAEVALDNKYRIIKYLSRDGSLTLEGKHYGTIDFRQVPKPEQSSAHTSSFLKRPADCIEAASKIARTELTFNAVKEAKPVNPKELAMFIDEVFGKMNNEVQKPKICQENRPNFFIPVFPPTFKSTLPKESVPLSAQRKFLEDIQKMVNVLDLPINAQMKNSIQNTIDKFDQLDMEQKVKASEIELTVFNAVQVIWESEGVDQQPGSKYAHHFLFFLRNAVKALEHPELKWISERIQFAMNKTPADKRIAISKVQQALAGLVKTFT